MKKEEQYLLKGRKKCNLAIHVMAMVSAMALMLVATTPASSSPVVDVGDGHIDTIGSTTTIDIILSEAPNGLSGYNLTLSLSNPSVAEIVSVSYPSWATMHTNSALPADSVWIKAADLADQITSGATNVNLATLTLRGDNPGTTDIIVTATKVDDDAGSPINPSTDPGHLGVGPECGNMDVSPLSWSPTIDCGESDSQTVTVSASGAPVEGVTVSQVSGPAWLSVSPTNLGDIATGSSETSTMTASPPAGTSGDFAYTIRVENTCGTPSSMDVTGTIHVGVSKNEVFLVPQQSNACFCNTVEVRIWANTTDTFGAGQINLTYDYCCANVTDFEYGSLWGGTWDSSVDGKEWLVFMRPLGQPTISGTVLIGNLTIHCCNESECVTPLIFSTPSKLCDPIADDLTVTWREGTFTCPAKAFDTGPGTYPSIAGTHRGKITPSCNINVSKLYTYPCSGTGGHTEYAAISHSNGTVIAEAHWNGYVEDCHNITFDKTITLVNGETYYYTMRIGSYPQIHHTPTLQTKNGWINCTEFRDINGKTYINWIPAIKLLGPV